MSSDFVLRRVAATHAIVSASLLAVLHALGQPLRGAVLGSALIAFSFLTFWVVARSITDPRRKTLAIVLGALKVVVYLGLTAAVLSGRLVADGLGFALGVTSFVVATLAGSFFAPSAAELRET